MRFHSALGRMSVWSMLDTQAVLVNEEALGLAWARCGLSLVYHDLRYGG